MTYTFTRKTDNVDKIMAADINELQAAIEDISGDVDTMSNINATFLLSAAGAIPAATNGCADPAVKSTINNMVMYKVCAFDKDTIESCWWNHPLPSDYNGGTVKFRVYWGHPATSTNFKVAWALVAIAVSNNESIDATPYAAVQINDAGHTVNDQWPALSISSWSTPLTITGYPEPGEMVYWRLSRVANDGTNDTLAVDAWLQYVEIKYTRA